MRSIRIACANLWHGTGFKAALGILILCCARVPSRAEPVTWIPSSAQSKNVVSDDLELSLRARNVLFQDEVLAEQLLGISVRNRVATLWGRASSTRLARRAEECLRSLRGLAAVRNEVHVQDFTALQDRQFQAPAGTARFPDMQRVPAAPVDRVEEHAPGSRQEFSWRPARDSRMETLPESAPRSLGHNKQPAVEGLPGFPASDTPRHSPVATQTIPRTKAEAPTASMPAVSPPLTPSPTTSSLAQAVEALRVADDRFRGVRVEVRGDTVYLRGMVYRWEHLFELARAISRLPSVREVFFDEIRAEIDP